MPTARVNGVDLYYEIHGRGPVVVLAHGFSAGCRMWDGQVAAFADRYRMLVYDARGQGRSGVPDHADAYSQPLMVEDLGQLLTHLGIERASVGGLSMGGNVALNFALAHPERVERALICDTGAGSEEPARWAEKVRGWIVTLEQEGVAAFADAYIRDPILADYARRGPEAEAFLRRAITANSARGLARGLAGVVGRRPSIHSLADSLRRLSVPTTVVVGDRDTWCVSVSRFLAETIPGAALEVIADAGHMTNLEQPEAFNAAMARWLARS